MASKYLNLTYRLATSESCLTWCCFGKGHLLSILSKMLKSCSSYCLAITHCKPKSQPIVNMNECEWNTTLPSHCLLPLDKHPFDVISTILRKRIVGAPQHLIISELHLCWARSSSFRVSLCWQCREKQLHNNGDSCPTFLFLSSPQGP